MTDEKDEGKRADERNEDEEPTQEADELGTTPLLALGPSFCHLDPETIEIEMEATGEEAAEPQENGTAEPAEPRDELEDDLALGAWGLRELQAHPEIDEMERERETATPELKPAPERDKKEKHRRQSRGM